MKIPEGMSEQEVIDTIRDICRKLSNTYKFPPYTKEDIEQQGFIEGMKGLDKYNGKHPLKNFLSVVIKSRLKNFKRDNYKRNDPPCKICANAIDGKTKHRNKKLCDKYVNWYKKNEDKQNIINAIPIDVISEESHEHSCPVLIDVDCKELLDKIDEQLPIELRKDYLKVKDGLKLSKEKMLILENEIRRILGEDFE